MSHPEHNCHSRINDFWSCFMSNLGGDWMQMIINEVLAIFQSKRDSNMLSAPIMKISVNGASTIFSILSQVIEM
jgi:hypothetical protein